MLTRQERAPGWTQKPSPGPTNSSPPLSPLRPQSTAPHHLRRRFFHRFLRLPHKRVSFALESCSRCSLLPLSTSLRSLVARLLAHFLTYYGRGIQPSSGNTTKPALFMTIQSGRRQYGAASQPAPRPLRPALSPAPSSFGPLEARRAPPGEERAQAAMQTPVKKSVWFPPCLWDCSSRQTAWKVIWNIFSLFL